MTRGRGQAFFAPVEMCGTEQTLAAVGTGLLVGNARADGERWGVDPQLLSPHCPAEGQKGRCEARLDLPQEILFAEVRDARRYFVVLRTREGGRLELAPADLECRPWPALKDLFEGSRACTFPWPPSWKLPQSGAAAQLSIAAEVGEEVRKSGVSRLALLEQTKALPLREALREALKSPMPEALKRQVGILLDSGLYDEVAARLRLKTSLPPQLELVLADAYLHLDLPELGRYHFGRVLTANPQLGPSLFAGEAHLGLGLCALVLGQNQEAIKAFAISAELFHSMGLQERARRATELIEQARAAGPTLRPDPT